MSRTAGSSRDRRRARRAADRRASKGALTKTPATFDQLVAAAGEPLVAAGSGSTSLPLSEQDKAWDASGADQRVREWADATEKPNAKYGRAFFVKDGDGTNFGDYRLGYADVVDGTLTAIWRGVVAVAGALQGARGGVKGLSDAETASVKSKVASYYAKAAKQYDDDSIKPPWEGSSSENSLTLLALAELTPAQKADLDIVVLDGEVAMAGGSGEGMDAFLERRAYWESEFGGKPSKGTPADDRLKENQDDERPEEAALAQLMAFAVGDVQWGPEEGFVDLLCDLNDLLREGDNPYGYRAVDVSVKLDKAKIVDYDGDSEWVAPISIGPDGEPILSDQSEWIPVEDGSIEVPADEDEEDEPEMMGDAEDGEMSRAAGTFVTEAGTFATEADMVRFELRDIVLLADGATAPELPEAHQPGEMIPRRRPTPKAPSQDIPVAGGDVDENAAGEIAWRAIFVPEGRLTDDGRAFAPGSLTWRELPLSLMAMTETGPGGHEGAVLAGRIDDIYREGDLILAEGIFDAGEFGQNIARMVGDKTLRGLSVDTAIHEYEVGPRSEFFNEDGTWKTDRPERAEADDQPLEDILFAEEQDEPRVFVVTKGVIGMATVCPFPAFADASISLVASGGGAIWRYTDDAMISLHRRPVVAAAAPAEAVTLTLVPKSVVVQVKETGAEMTLALGTNDAGALTASSFTVNGTETVVDADLALEEDASLTAAAAGHAPLKPPADWFENPELDQLTPLTIDEDGRVYGHAWAWDVCHISFPDSCVLAPHSQTENAYFHLGEIECDDGSKLSVGKITLDAPHAGARLSRVDATAHYDQTGTVVAHIVCGEDAFGGWVAGAIVPDLPEAKLRLLRGSALSGDWRNVNGSLELVALLAVNVPGFPVPRPRALVAAGAEGTEEVLALTAAGIVLDAKTPCETVAEIEALAAEVAPPVEDEFAALVEQAEEV